MSIPYQRVPGALYETDGSRALGAQPPDPHNALLIGFRVASAPVAAGVVTEIVGETDGESFFGIESQLGPMCTAFKRINKSARLYALAVDQDEAGNAASASFVFSGSPTKTGPIKVRIGDRRITALVNSGDSATVCATKLNTAINLVSKRMFTSLSSTVTVSLACVHKGEVGNQVTIAVEDKPAGLSVVVTQPNGGATNPDLGPTIALIDDTRYDTFISGLTDASNIAKLENEAERRWQPDVQRWCQVIAAIPGSHGTLTTYGNARNSRFSTIMGSGASPTPPWIWAAQTAGRDAQRCDTQPNQPRKGLVLTDCEAPPKNNRFDNTQRNLLYYDGISSFTVDQAGRVKIDRLITTYQVNDAGLSDATYLDLGDMRTLARLAAEYVALGAKHEDSLIVDDDQNVMPGIKVTSPKMLKGELIALNGNQMFRALTKDADGFATELMTEVDILDTQRINANLGSRLVRGLVTLAMRNFFKL